MSALSLRPQFSFSCYRTAISRRAENRKTSSTFSCCWRRSVPPSVIGLFYYLRIIVGMSTPAAEEEVVEFEAVPWAGGTTLAALTLILIWLGVYPPPLISLIRLTALQVGN
jgi:NADH:ubiquinone oxidoreductase subunit 4 (subunit M)